ncbi:hypothetical protein F4811DRAFT_536678 [Daldinia bambusicola]|nr:hypothetical protein F4811DRAFT_536678 [Daldinia bambusicola]
MGRGGSTIDLGYFGSRYFALFSFSFLVSFHWLLGFAQYGFHWLDGQAFSYASLRHTTNQTDRKYCTFYSSLWHQWDKRPVTNIFRNWTLATWDMH